MIKRLIVTSNNGGEYQICQFAKRRSPLSKYKQQVQTNNRLLLLE